MSSFSQLLAATVAKSDLLSQPFQIASILQQQAARRSDILRPTARYRASDPNRGGRHLDTCHPSPHRTPSLLPSASSNTAGAGLPRQADGTDESIRTLLRYRAFDLFGYVPPSEGRPAKPAEYDYLLWADPTAAGARLGAGPSRGDEYEAEGPRRDVRS